LQVSFIIPLYNCLSLTQAMLASLQATLPPGLSHEIVFIDDGSSDGTREWLQALTATGRQSSGKHGQIHTLFNDRNSGYAVSNNRAAAIAQGEFLVLLNNDLILQPRWLEPMLAAHAALRIRAGLIGNVQLEAKSGAVDHTGLVVNITGKPMHSRRLPSRPLRWIRPLRRVPAVTGACMLVARDLWKQLGGFDENYLNGGEDIDLCFRARAAGKINAVALRSIVRHHVSASPGRKARDEQNSHRLARRWQAELIAAADDGTRAWCRDYLAHALYIPESAEYRLALAACAFLAHLRPTPPPEAITAVARGLDGEFARWEKMFGS
jgi:GT2 family glycosyltransferase